MESLNLWRMGGSIAVLGILIVPQLVAAQSTSPLEILKQAPKVHFDEQKPTPPPRQMPAQPTPPLSGATMAPRLTPAPFAPPPRGAPPVIHPVEPAFTPYSGNSVGGVMAPRYEAPTPTPRPVLGPRDVKPKKKKRGFVRGLINAIPFVGGDDDEEDAQPSPTPEPTPKYRGYDEHPTRDSGGPILLPPGSTPVSSGLTAEPEPTTSPPIMTPLPRKTAPGAPVDTYQEPLATPPDTEANPTASGAPLLTVKRESDVGVVEPDSVEKQPEVAPSDSVSTILPEPTASPVPLEHATTAVLIQESRPDDSSLGPKPDSSATPLEPYDPTITPAPDTVDPSDEVTSLTVKQSDLGMPNPTYEQNAVVLGEFQDAVRKARTEDYTAAARQFRDYSLNHPSSGLAPRAYYLSVIFEKSLSQGKENLAGLENRFPESRYVDEAKERRPELLKPAPSTTGVANGGSGVGPVSDATVSTETPRQKVERLEQELTAAVGDSSTEPELRKQLGLAYLELQEYDRAYEVLRPAVEMSKGTPIESDVLMAMGRVLVARGETVQAISLYEAVELKNPDLIYRDPASAWSVGLAYEGAGRYNKARAVYNTIRQRWPAATEAGWASKRLTDLASLRR